MDITVDKGPLLAQLALASGTVSRKPTLPALGGVLLRVNGDGAASFSATDLDLTVRGACPVTVAKAGSVLIPATRLHDLVRSFPEDAPVRLATDAHNGVAVTAGGFRGRLQAHVVDDFPQLPEAEGTFEALASAAALRALIVRTRFAVTQDDKRYFLAGALLEADGTALRLVTTDARRLALASVPRTGTVLPPVIVPKKALDALAALLDGAEGDVSMARNGSHLFFLVGDSSLAARQIDGQFPQYQRILPAAFRATVTLPRLALLEVVRRALLVSETESRRVTLALEPGALAVAAQSADVGDSDERITCTHAHADVAVKVNGAYVLDFLEAAATDEVLLELNDATTAVGLRAVGGDVDYRYIVMPQVA